MTDLFNYQRRTSCEVQVGDTPMGASHPIRLQSMTTTPTADVEASSAQALRLARAGAEYVRLTTQGVREAEALREINARLRGAGCTVPLVADVHFNPHVAEVAALYAEKVRINPGNYIDPARTFRHIEYTGEEYAAELRRLEERFLPLLRLCREHHTALRIGVNHGSLSDRIMSRYGDSPEGMVESCMEFLRVCRRERFDDVVISIKASNPVVMVRTVRLLAATMEQEEMAYPLHLGVTEAGEGEDGRIKSALGIGALLMDGLGDTIRVSLSEEPEAEIPVARKLRDYCTARQGHPYIPGRMPAAFDYLRPTRRPTDAAGPIGGGQVPVVISARLDGRCDCNPRFRPDFFYLGSTLPEAVAQELRAADGQAAPSAAAPGYIVDSDAWQPLPRLYPAFSYSRLVELHHCPAPLKFLFLPYMALGEEARACLRRHPEVVVIAQSNHPNRLGEHRALAFELQEEGLRNPVVTFQHYADAQLEDLQLHAAADMGALLLDGLSDGLMLFSTAQAPLPAAALDQTAYAILQAARLRMTKTEYISCPGCGRTLYDLPETLRRIKEATAPLAGGGLKIGVMGCIVNGPGEMADADYGYVGAGRGRISLYKGKECVEKNIPEAEAVDKLVALIKRCGDWREE